MNKKLKKNNGVSLNELDNRESFYDENNKLKQSDIMIGWLTLSFVLILFSFSISGFAQKKIYIVTDMEGISGVFKWQQCKTKDSPLYDKASEYFMGDLSAVVRGLKEGGATEIVVLDGHGYQNVVPHLMEPGVKYITGTPRPGPALYGLDETFDGMVQLGAHSMYGTPGGVLNHTQSSSRKFKFWYNGVETGEIGMAALAAGYFEVPTIMVSGDLAACKEAHKFFGDDVVAVAVKEGISTEAAILYPFEETRQVLYEGAKRAMLSIDKCNPYKIETPFTVKLEYIIIDEVPEKVRYIERTYPDIKQVYDIMKEDKPKN